MDIKEQVIKKFHPHPFSFLGFYFGGFVLAILGIILAVLEVFPFGLAISIGFSSGVLAIVLGEVVRRAETFYVLEYGVSWQYKLFSTSRKFAEYEKLQNLEVNQSFLERMLGIGSIHFDTAGIDKIEVNFHGIKNPYGIEKIVREKMVKH